MDELKLLYRKACAAVGEKIGKQSRKQHLVYARFCYFHYAKKLTFASLEEIGLSCGKRDHATVIHGLKQFDKLYLMMDLPSYRKFRDIHNKIYNSMHNVDLSVVDVNDAKYLKKRISKLENENYNLKMKINKISSLGLDRLPDDKIELFRTTRLEPFLKMNA